MRKIFLVLVVLIFLLIGVNAFAADGDLIVNGKIGVGTTNPTSKVTVNGTIESTSGGIKFPDGTVQTTAGGSSGGGKISQVLSTTKTDAWSTSSTTYVTIPGLSVTVTPSSVNSKILVMSNVYVGHDYSTVQVNMQLLRGSTPICIGDTAGSRGRTTITFRVPNDGQFTYGSTYPGSISCMDSPNTTSPVTYSWQIKSNTGNVTINRSGADPDDSMYGRMTSQITVMEVAP